MVFLSGSSSKLRSSSSLPWTVPVFRPRLFIWHGSSSWWCRHGIWLYFTGWFIWPLGPWFAGLGFFFQNTCQRHTWGSVVFVKLKNINVCFSFGVYCPSGLPSVAFRLCGVSDHFRVHTWNQLKVPSSSNVNFLAAAMTGVIVKGKACVKWYLTKSSHTLGFCH